MWQSNKKYIVIAVLAALPIIVLMLIGEGCTQAGDSNGSQTETETAVNEMPNRMQSQMPLGEVAKILGIDQEKLEDAIAQARSELGDEGMPPPSGEGMPSPPSEGTPPTGMPSGPGLPSNLLARVAEILGIDQQKLEDAFAKAQSEMPAQAAPPSSNQQ